MRLRYKSSRGLRNSCRRKSSAFHRWSVSLLGTFLSVNRASSVWARVTVAQCPTASARARASGTRCQGTRRLQTSPRQIHAVFAISVFIEMVLQDEVFRSTCYIVVCKKTYHEMLASKLFFDNKWWNQRNNLRTMVGFCGLNETIVWQIWFCFTTDNMFLCWNNTFVKF